MIYFKLHWKLVMITATNNPAWMKFHIPFVPWSSGLLMSFFGRNSEELCCSLGMKNRCV